MSSDGSRDPIVGHNKTRNKSHYAEKVDIVKKYIADNSLRLHPAQEKLKQATLTQPRAGMMSCGEELQLLQNIVRLIKGKKAIDIGVYTGYSALSIALVLPEDGLLVACELDETPTKIGQPIWKEAGVDKKIDLRIGPAIDTLERLIAEGQSGTFDFAFIDADKPNYNNYYEACLKLMRSGGVIAVDNALWGGDVVDLDITDPNTVAIRDLNKKIHQDERVDSSLLTVGDGTQLVFKR